MKMEELDIPAFFVGLGGAFITVVTMIFALLTPFLFFLK